MTEGAMLLTTTRGALDFDAGAVTSALRFPVLLRRAEPPPRRMTTSFWITRSQGRARIAHAALINTTTLSGPKSKKPRRGRRSLPSRVLSQESASHSY